MNPLEVEAKLLRKRTGAPRCCLGNALVILKEDPRWRDVFALAPETDRGPCRRRWRVRRTVRVLRAVNGLRGPVPRAFDPVDWAAVVLWIQTHYNMRATRAGVTQAVYATARDPRPSRSP